MEETSTFATTLKDLGESSSLHGIPKVVASRQVPVKFLWGFLLCGALILFGLQFAQLLQEYQAYQVKTTVSLKFASLPFPAVTVCNMNPFKMNSLIYSPESDTLRQEVFRYGDFGNIMEESITEVNDRFYEQFDDDGAYNIDFDIDDDDEIEFTRSLYDYWKTSVLAALRDTPINKRIQLGHQLDDFIRISKFAGFKFNASDQFRTVSDSQYGNCFTVDSLPFARTSGQDNGLTLQLNLEINEYFEHFTTAYGAVVLIHESGTYPLPHRDGLILNPGFETNIGLKAVKARRLGGMYGTCVDGKEYGISGRNYKHTVSLCHALCERDLIKRHCNCSQIEIPSEGTLYRTCNANDTQCIYNARKHLANAVGLCYCPTTCTEDSYITTITGRAWPVKTYLEKVLLNEVCGKNATTFTDDCYAWEINGSLSYENYQKVSKNFLKVNIYFEDLNYEEISEEPLYNMIRFLSDIGGTMGLFLGASLLTFVEVLQLILEIIIFLKPTASNLKTPPVTKLKIQPLNE